MAANENPTARRQQKPGALVHGGYWLWKLMRSGAPNRRTAVGRRWEARRLSYALSKGFPTWEALPAPLQDSIDNALRAVFLAAAMFAPFWEAGPEGVPQRYATIAEHVRRQLSDIGLDVADAVADVASIMAKMTEQDTKRR